MFRLNHYSWVKRHINAISMDYGRSICFEQSSENARFDPTLWLQLLNAVWWCHENQEQSPSVVGRFPATSSLSAALETEAEQFLLVVVFGLLAV